jgi:hypothetical protein
MGESTFKPVEGTDETRFLQWNGRDQIPTGSRKGENTFPLVVGMDETTFLQGVGTTKTHPQAVGMDETT